MLGIYEASIRKISFETGISSEMVSKALKGFESINKVKRINDFIILVNFMKHQNYNTNMKKSAIDTYNTLPKELKDSSISVDKDNPLKGFETLLNHYGMVRKIEVEYEVEVEKKEKEKEKEGRPTYEDFLSHAVSKIQNVCPQAVKLKHDSWVENGWKDGNGNKITNWKSKLTNTVGYLKTLKSEDSKYFTNGDGIRIAKGIL